MLLDLVPHLEVGIGSDVSPATAGLYLCYGEGDSHAHPTLSVWPRPVLSLLGGSKTRRAVYSSLAWIVAFSGVIAASSTVGSKTRLVL